MLLCINAAGDWSAGDLQVRALWEEMLDELDAVSPLIEDVRPGLAFLDMHGAPGEAPAWIERTHALLARFGIPMRLGVGANKMVARAAAYVADGSVCRAGGERALLEPLSLALLEIDPKTIERLRLLGIDSLGDLARLPHGPFVRRFGKAAAHWHALARGIDSRPFEPRGHAVAIEAAIFGEGRATDEAQVLFALRVLLARVCADLERCGKRAGALRLEIELEDADTQSMDVPLAMPTAHERTMFEMLRAKLAGTTFASGIVGLRVRALRLEEGGEAQALFAADDLDPQKVAITIARLEAVLGESIARARTREAHVLEERFVYEPFAPPAKAMFAPAHPEGELVPQLRLLELREVPVELRGGAPAVVGQQAVLECVGPWRVAERAYVPAPVTRDEYDVVLEDGTFARIYRQGTHWYVRGIYE